MKRIKKETLEEKCPACDGTGYPTVKQPAPGRRIFPSRCTECDGKGRIKKPAESALEVNERVRQLSRL